MVAATDKQWGDDYSIAKELEKKLHTVGVFTLWAMIIATIVLKIVR